MSWLTGLLWASWNVLLVAAPFVLLGLFTAGVLHVVLSRHLVERWMGREGLSGVVAAALFGMPLPMCSCGVVPVALTLRRKGASRPAVASFLISTPETGVDSILLTWGLLGPLMAVARPLAAFLTAVLAGIGIIALDEETRPAAAAPRAGDEHVGHDHDDEAHVVGATGLWRAIRVAVAPRSQAAAAAAGSVRPLDQVMADVRRYAFVDLLDDIVFWLVVGIVLAGGVELLVPADLATRIPSGGLVPMLLALAIGVPLYVCASASTPVAAALVAKGVSPGTALVFLLAGPATNAATIMLLSRHFGARFVKVYLVSIAGAALACGLALDALLAATGWSVVATLSGGLGGVALVQWLSAAVLAVLMAWRLWAGAGRQGLREAGDNVEAVLRLSLGERVDWRAWRRGLARRGIIIGIVAAVVGWIASGVRVIPPDGRGYGFLFGRLAWPDLSPGLHYVPPWPLGRLDVWRVHYSRLGAVGFQPDLAAVANRRQLTRLAGQDLWHSPITASRTDPQVASFLTGDENLLEISFAVVYGLSDPVAYFYAVDKDRDPVRLYAESMARQFVATRRVDELLTTGRAELERVVAARLQDHLDRLGAGVRIDAVLVVDLHPPQGAVGAFRDVAGAREQRETVINGAAAEQAREVPLAHGTAATTLAAARATAAGAALEARGRADGFLAQADAYRSAPDLLGELLWLETAERVLAGREKLIVPPGSAGRHVALWRTAPGVAGPDLAPPPNAGGSP